MIYNEMLHELEARQKLLVGAKKLAKAVSSTLGPKGRNGITVANSIVLQNKFENIGAQLLREAGQSTNDKCGDGTTSSIVIASALLSGGQDLITLNNEPLDIKRGIEKALTDVVVELKRITTQITSFKEVAQIGVISANNDKVIGDIIANAMEQVGKEGVITIEMSSDADTKLEIVDGVRFNQGFQSHYFVTNQERHECIFENPLIFISNKHFRAMHEVTPLLEYVAKKQKPLFLICSDIDGEALNTLIINHARGIIKACAVIAPSFGDKKKLLLEDFAILTGAVFQDVDINSDIVGMLQDNAFGTARKVIASKNTTTIVEGRCNDDVLNQRIETLKAQIENTNDTFTLEGLRERLANLTGGIAIVKVGAHTEIELVEKIARIEDALNATHAAVSEGIVPGGGLALLYAAHKLNRNIENIDLKLKSGYKLLLNACEEPFKRIIINAGYDIDNIYNIVQEHLMNEDLTYGFNSLTGEFVNMIEQGIIDPCMVERTALENAVSVVGLLLTTNTLVIKNDSDKGNTS
jgi:chaperonin GroEL